MNDYKMTPGERRATWGLGTVFSLRMLGMFMVLPVLTTYGMALQGASEALIGIAIGIYGLTQPFFQIPFGLLSDRIGRKPLIVGGLAVFAAGSVIAALSDSIWGNYSGPGATRLRCDCRCRYGAAFRSHARTKPHQSNGVYRRELWHYLCHCDGAWPDHHSQTWAARAVLDDRYSGNNRHCVDHLGCAQQ
ncbi:transport protein YajR [Escherichia coli]|uniref:Transport protein YajR n=1 Tax=Escherichia coli TaxID=562 RepID=A0A485JIN3_ECOLX|nr:transport protein YajR [Escherichia coli]